MTRRATTRSGFVLADRGGRCCDGTLAAHRIPARAAEA